MTRRVSAKLGVWQHGAQLTRELDGVPLLGGPAILLRGHCRPCSLGVWISSFCHTVVRSRAMTVVSKVSEKGLI